MSSKKRIMICVTQQKSCERLIERGSDLSRSKKDELFVVHVVKENWKYFGQLKEADALDYLFEVSKSHSASLAVIKAADIEETLKNFAVKNKIDVIVMGESNEKDSQQNMINRLQSKTQKNIKFDIVPTYDEILKEA